jgi:hypothetical protein
MPRPSDSESVRFSLWPWALAAFAFASLLFSFGQQIRGSEASREVRGAQSSPALPDDAPEQTPLIPRLSTFSTLCRVSRPELPSRDDCLGLEPAVAAAVSPS